MVDYQELRLERGPPGTLRWRLVWPDGTMWQRYETRWLAEAVLAIVSGDPSRAPVAYREVLRRSRKQMRELDALRYTRMWAAALGLSLTAVRADARTGEPLEG